MNRIQTRPRYGTGEILRKEPFKTVLSVPDIGSLSPVGPLEEHGGYIYYTQADFMRQFHVSGHRINDPFWYKDREKWLDRTNERTGNTYKEKYIHRVTRVALPMQRIIATKRITALTGNNIDMSLPGGSQPGPDTERRYYEYVGGWRERDMELAWYYFVKSALITGDAALCGYFRNGRFGWKALSYMDGYTLWPHYDFNGEMDAFGLTYSMDTPSGRVTYLDVWDSMYVHHYTSGGRGPIGSLISKMDDWLTGNGGWRYTGSDIHGYPFLPITYFRTYGPCWLDVQSPIEQLELAYSRLAENNRAYALRILFTKGAALAMESTVDGQPYQINAPDPDSDARFLEPADMSGSMKAEIEGLEDIIYRGSFTVKTPDVRGSDLSGLAVELLFTDSSQMAHCETQELKPALNGISRIYAYGMGKEKGLDLEGLHVIPEAIPFMPKSETEEVSNIVQLVSSGTLSRRTGSEKATSLGYGVTAEWLRVQREEREMLIGQADNRQAQDDTGTDRQ